MNYYANAIHEYFKKNRINVNYDPDRSIHKTWFGREIPIHFDNPSISHFSKDKKEVHLITNGYSIDKIARDTLHEIGHANTSFGKNIFLDPYMIPSTLISLYFSFENIKSSPDNMGIGVATGLLLPIPLRYGISEFIAGLYHRSKVISGKLRKAKNKPF